MSISVCRPCHCNKQHHAVLTSWQDKLYITSDLVIARLGKGLRWWKPAELEQSVDRRSYDSGRMVTSLSMVLLAAPRGRCASSWDPTNTKETPSVSSRQCGPQQC